MFKTFYSQAVSLIFWAEVVMAQPISRLVFNKTNVPGSFQHRSEKCSVFSLDVVAMARIRYHFRPVLPVEGEE